MEAEELLKKLLENPEIAKMAEQLVQPEKKKRGRPKKKKDEPKKPSKNDIHIINAKMHDPKKGTPGKVSQFDKNKLKKIQFVNDGVARDEIDDLIKYPDPTPRIRKTKKITKICEVCNKEVELSPILGSNNSFRCDDCIINQRGIDAHR